MHKKEVDSRSVFHHLYDRQVAASSWFKELQLMICSEFEKIESEYQSNAKFVANNWNYHQQGGGASMSMKGEVFEKVGVNFSEVSGCFEPEFAKQIPGTEDGGDFWASGISLVAHMKNPKVPSVHMNTRMIITRNANWIGGGADLTPSILFDDDTKDFHAAFEKVCNKQSDQTRLSYERLKKWCDDYFYIPHRKEARGIGGIFYDYIDITDFNSDFSFNKDVGIVFLDVFASLVRRRMHESYNADDKRTQLIKRGRYAEFNLVYDRGTKFGLMTGGNIDAILMSLPPEAIWP